MNEDQLNGYIKQLGISRDQILREEAEMEFLRELSEDKLGSKVIFYGGTALRLAFGSPRFSEDIDLLKIKSFTFTEFTKFVQRLTKGRQNWSIKDIKDKRQTMFALILIKDEKMKHSFSLKIEIRKPAKKVHPVKSGEAGSPKAKFNRVKLETVLSLIKSPLSIAEPLLLVPTLQELKRLKESALFGRKKARDIFDLWYIAQSLRENFIIPQKTPSYQKREFKNELQVFLPKKYHPIIDQLYEQIIAKNK
jgi:predicted nucleotidyltransferase component of viral defense system